MRYHTCIHKFIRTCGGIVRSVQLVLKPGCRLVGRRGIHVAVHGSHTDGGLGLAQMLYEQMKRNYGVSDIPGTEEAAAAEQTA